MFFKTASATCATGNLGNNAREAVRILRNAFAGFSTNFVIYFTSTDYDADVVASEMFDAFPGAVTLGCTTAGEGVDGKIMNGSVVAMAFAPEVFGYCETALVLEDRKKVKALARPDIFFSAVEAGRYLARNVGRDLRGLNYRDYVGFMLGDRISDFSERVVERIGDLTDVLFIGGFSGDDYKFDGSYRVMYQGKAYRDGAAVLALLKPARGFSLLKTQAVEMTDRAVIVTRVDERDNIVWELDGEDATVVYSRLMGIPVESMDVLDFDENPWASTVNGEPFLRAVMEKVDGKGLRFTSRIHEGSRLTLTKAGNIFETTREALEKKREEVGGVSAILHVNCASRHTALKKWGQVDEFAALFGSVPSISVSSYGEIYVGLVAMTSTMLLFK